VVEVVAQDGGGVVEEGGDGVFVALEVGRGEDFGEEVGVVAPAGFDEEFLVCGALKGCQRWERGDRKLRRRTSCSCSFAIAMSRWMC
jgi:hypothetical protein